MTDLAGDTYKKSEQQDSCGGKDAFRLKSSLRLIPQGALEHGPSFHEIRGWALISDVLTTGRVLVNNR